MTLTCPCCRATNTADACRRCKADLSLMTALEAVRECHIAAARRLLAEGDAGQAVAHINSAAALRPADDLRPVRAAALLLSGQFADALAAYHSTV